jgi:hypothetical protein
MAMRLPCFKGSIHQSTALRSLGLKGRMPMRSLPVAVVLWYGSAEAAMLTSGVLGCKTSIDAYKAETLRAKNDAAGLETFSRYRPKAASPLLHPLSRRPYVLLGAGRFG